MPLIKTTANLKLEKPEAAHNAWEQAYWRLATIVDLWLTQLAKGHHVVRGGGLTLNGANVDLAATAVAFEGQFSAHALAAQTAITGLVAGNTYVVYVDNAGALQVSTLSAANLWSGSLPADFVLLGLAFEVEGMWAIHTQPLLRDRAADRRLAHVFLPRPTDPPTMKVRLLAGYLHDGGSPTEVAEQESATISAPAVDPKIVRVGVSLMDGSAVLIDGAEATVPAAPGYPAGVMPVCRVPLTTAHTEISEADIIDERTLTQGWVEPQVTAVIEAAGITLEKGTQDQLLKAVNLAPVLGMPGTYVPLKVLPWRVAEAGVFIAPAFSVSSEGTGPQVAFFDPSGTKMLVLDSVAAEVNPYTLSTPWDLTTAVFDDPFSDGSGFPVGTQDSAPTAIFVDPSGTRMLVLGQTADEVNPYTMTTPWDLTSATFDDPFLNGTGFSVAAQEIQPQGLFVDSTGTRMFIIGTNGDDVNPYTMSTPWDLTTATFDDPFLNGTGFSVAAQEIQPQGLVFDDSGTRMLISGGQVSEVNPYTLSTPWDVTTAVFDDPYGDGTGYPVASVDASPQGLFVDPTGTRMFLAGFTGGIVAKFSVGQVVAGN